MANPGGFGQPPRGFRPQATSPGAEHPILLPRLAAVPGKLAPGCYIIGEAGNLEGCDDSTHGLAPGELVACGRNRDLFTTGSFVVVRPSGADGYPYATVGLTGTLIRSLATEVSTESVCDTRARTSKASDLDASSHQGWSLLL